MADSTKNLHIPDFKSLFSLKNKNTLSFAYGFMFAFILFTAFLAFYPSQNSTNSFSFSGSQNSNFPSILSYFFPNSSRPVFNFNTTTLNQTHNPQNKTQNGVLDGKGGILKANSSSNSTGGSLVQKGSKDLAKSSSNSTGGNMVKNGTEGFGKGEIFKANSASNGTEGNMVKKGSEDLVKSFSNSTGGNMVKKGSEDLGKGETFGAKSSSNGTGGNMVKRDGEDFGKGEIFRAKSDLNSTKGNMVKEDLVKGLMGCDLFDGEWVRDDSYPLYKPGSCSLVDEQFNCFVNGRPDKDFQKYKWKPKGCTIPRLNGSHMLELLRGKRLVFVGDSLNRNMWESLICILRNSVKDQKKVYEASGRHHFRGDASYSFVFEDYKCTIELFVSPFLVREWEVSEKNGAKKETLRLDLIGTSAERYKSADVIIFNTGHWWTHDKTSKGKDYYQEGSHVYGELNVLEAFRKALTTWARWVDANVNPRKSLVFFRGYSASHFSGGQWNSGGACDHETEPIKNATFLRQYPPKMLVLEKVLKVMKTPVLYQNITTLTDYRKDGHPSMYRKQHLSEGERKSPLLFQDCSHWCLPGVPDIWNELLYAELVLKEYQQKRL